MVDDQSASTRIAELLKHHDDLDKVASLKAKLQKEKAVVDGQLKAGVQAQISVTLKAMERLNLSKQNVESIAGHMDKVDKLRQDSEEGVENFNKINQLSTILQKFETTQRFIDNFRDMSDQLSEIQRLMAEDGKFDPVAPMENLVTVHYKLSELRDVQDDSWNLAERSTDDVRRTITKHFGQLDRVVKEFDQVVMDIASELLEIIRQQNPSLVVRTAKIIDYEEKQDLASDISKEITKDDTVLTASLQNKASHRKPRNYPQRFFETIEKNVQETFENCRKYFEEEEDQTMDDMLDSLEWIFSDLELVQIELVKCVPSRWKIFDKYVGYYHNQAYELLNYVLDQDPNAATILHILQYVKEYYGNMNTLGVAKDKLQPPLLDGRENKLYDDYLSLIVSKLREWRQNLSSTEKTNFIERQVPPDTDDENRLGMQGEVVMFSIISQQVDVAADSGQGRILAGCVEECSNILLERQRDWEQTMKGQVELQINDTATDEESSVPGGLVEYLFALANDQIKGADYTEAISSRVAPLVSKKYRQSITSNFDRASDGYVAMAKSCVGGLINIIFADLGQPFKEIFKSSSWKKGKPMRQIVDTIQEYIVDCQQHMNPIIFEVFTDDLLEETILRYLGALNKDGLKLNDKNVERVEADVGDLYELFTAGVFESQQDHIDNVKNQFTVFAHLFATLSCPEEEIREQFQKLRQDFWDAPLDLFHLMVKARANIEKSTIKDIMRDVRTDALQTQMPPENGEPTYLSRFKVTT